MRTGVLDVIEDDDDGGEKKGGGKEERWGRWMRWWGRRTVEKKDRGKSATDVQGLSMTAEFAVAAALLYSEELARPVARGRGSAGCSLRGGGEYAPNHRNFENAHGARRTPCELLSQFQFFLPFSPHGLLRETFSYLEGHARAPKKVTLFYILVTPL